jgi:hypothetical protein
MNIDFHKKYIDVNFDEILTKSNNPLLNSETVYLNFKNSYFDETLKSYKSFQEYNTLLQSLQTISEHSSDTKYVYVYKNDKRIFELTQKIKDIVIEQERRFNNFYHYVTVLNTNRSIFGNKQTSSEKKGFFSKLFEKK